MDANCLEVLEVQQDFKSLTAKSDIPKGTFLGDFWGRVTNQRDVHTHQIGPNIHIEGEGQSRYTNHSCSPNAHFVYHVRNVADSFHLKEGHELSWPIIATRAIAKGEGITVDYTLTEYTMAAPFDCVCKSPNCLGKVQGFKFLSPEEKSKRLPNASPVVKDLLENESN